MITSLIIQVLTREDAVSLIDEVFSEEPLDVRIVSGSFSGTFGIMIRFDNWYSSLKAAPEFLYGTKVERITSMKPSELYYYENILSRKKFLESVSFCELFPNAGYYSFGSKDYLFFPSTKQIYDKRKRICYSIAETLRILDWVNKNPEPSKISWLSKLYRRGFINEETVFISWKHYLGEILDC